MNLNLPEKSPLEGKRLENLSLILSHMKIRGDIKYVRSMPSFLLSSKFSYGRFVHEGTRLQIFSDKEKSIAFAKPDSEYSFSEICDGAVAENITEQMEWIGENFDFYLASRTLINLKFCYISAPTINIFCVGLYGEIARGPKYWSALDIEGERRILSTHYMKHLFRKKIKSRLHKGLSRNGVPPN